MNSRHHAREVALQILYQYDAVEPKDLAHELIGHFDHFQVPDGLRAFAAELVAGTMKARAELDTALESHAQNWKLSRMAAVDRNLLRMAAYEMKNFPDIPHSVTLDEAVELGKQFGSADTSAFINGILDAFAKTLPETK